MTLLLGACTTAGVSPVQTSAALQPIQNETQQQTAQGASTYEAAPLEPVQNNQNQLQTQQPQIQQAQTQTPALPGVENSAIEQPVFQNGTRRSGVAYAATEPSENNTLQLPQGGENPNVAGMQVMNPDAQTNDPNAQLAYVEPEVDPAESQAELRISNLYPTMKHSTCKGGWASQPAKLDAQRQTQGHPYYLEMRLRHTPLLPVGHTYIAYGRLSPEGKPIDEHVIMLSPVGGYGGAAVAAAVPMPGVLTPVSDDCSIKPIAAYRVSLNAQDYEKLLIRIKKLQADKPAYALFAYNCNHFASDVAAAVGIREPANKYVYALDYIYDVIEANEGYNPKKQRRRRG